MQFFQDLQDQIVGYYDDIIALLPKVLLGIVIALIFYSVASWLRRKLDKVVRLKSQDLLLPKFINQVLRITIVIISFLLFLYSIGQIGIVSGILGAAGLSAFVIGFAFKDIGENFLAGVLMAFDRPFRIGDTVQSQSVEGVIVEMNLRETHIKTFDGKDVYVPNGQILKNPLYNYTIDGFMRRSFTVGIDYGSDVEKAREIILEAVSATDGILTETKKPFCMVYEFASSTINIRVHFWIDTFDRSFSTLEVHSRAMNHTLQALTRAQVGMPGDVIEIKTYGSLEPLRIKQEN